MKLNPSFALCLGLSVFLTSCAAWKESGTSAKTAERAYTGAFFDGTTGITVGYSGLVKYTEDGGKTWIDGKNQSMCLFASAILDKKTCIAAGNGGNVVLSADGGKSWNHLANIKSTFAKSISFTDASHGWISAKGWLGETIDGGKNWIPMETPAEAGMIETICQTASGNGFLVGKNGSLYHTSNGGIAWEKISEPVPAADANFKPLFMNNTQGVSLTMQGENGILACIGFEKGQSALLIRATRDGGKTWEKPEIHRLAHTPMSVSISPNHTISIFSNDSTITTFLN